MTMLTPEEFVSTLETAMFHRKWPIDSDAAKRLEAHDNALRAEVARLTAERDALRCPTCSGKCFVVVQDSANDAHQEPCGACLGTGNLVHELQQLNIEQGLALTDQTDRAQSAEAQLATWRGLAQRAESFINVLLGYEEGDDITAWVTECHLAALTAQEVAR